MIGGCGHRGQYWYGWQSHICVEVSERKEHMVKQIMEKYIIGYKPILY